MPYTHTHTHTHTRFISKMNRVYVCVCMYIYTHTRSGTAAGKVWKGGRHKVCAPTPPRAAEARGQCNAGYTGPDSMEPRHITIAHNVSAMCPQVSRMRERKRETESARARERPFQAYVGAREGSQARNMRSAVITFPVRPGRLPLWHT